MLAMNKVLEVNVKNDVEINKSICALLNSNGGKLVLTAIIDNDKIDANEQIRRYKQYFKEKIGTYNLHKYFKISDSPQEYNRVTFVVLRLPTLCTLNTNLYLPTETQISLVSPTEQDALCEILFTKKQYVEISEMKVPEQFYYGRKHDRGESKTVQFKNLNAEKKRRNDFVSRAINNKITQYVSAFANGSGGMIYYGIDDDGTVVGELLAREEEDREEITKKLEQAIRKMIWPKESGKIERGKHWNIKFVPVKDCNEKRFVIVVSVSPCSGGVFTKEPESYYVEDGKVKKMSFETWKKNMYFKVKKILEIKEKMLIKIPEMTKDVSYYPIVNMNYRHDKLEIGHDHPEQVLQMLSKTTDNGFGIEVRSASFANEPALIVSVKNESNGSKNEGDKDFEGNVQEHLERAKGFCDQALQDLMNLITPSDDSELRQQKMNIGSALLYLKFASEDLASKLDIVSAEDKIKEAEEYIRNLEQITLPPIRNIYCLLSLAKSELHSILAKRCANKAANLIDEYESKEIKVDCKASKRDWKGRDKKQMNHNENKSDENMEQEQEEQVPRKKLQKCGRKCFESARRKLVQNKRTVTYLQGV